MSEQTIKIIVQVIPIDEPPPLVVGITPAPHGEFVPPRLVAQAPAWDGMRQDRTTIRELADRLGMDRSACRRYVLNLGHKPVLMRTAESGFQKALTLTLEEAESIVKFRASEGYVPPSVHVVAKQGENHV